jgi:putative ABC transport system ATP-binding protein
VIRLTNVSKCFAKHGSAAHALCSVDLQIEQGEFVAVTGASAAGKTTLLNIIGLIDTPSSGHYAFEGSDLRNCSDAQLTELRKRRIGFLFQGFRLIEDLTVGENVELPLRYQRCPRDRRRLATRELLELIGLDGHAHAYPDELSPGEQQCVAIARAVVHDPALLLADEPLDDIDEQNAARILDVLSTLHVVGTTVLMATHSPSWAARAERIVTLHNGHIVSD